MRKLLARCQTGLTLVEVMVVLAVLGVLLAVAVPAFQDLLHRQRIQSVTTELVSDLALLKATSAQVRHQSLLGFMVFDLAPTKNCYAVLAMTNLDGLSCDCSKPPGSACKAGDRKDPEVKIVKLPDSTGVRFVTTPQSTIRFVNGQRADFNYQILVEGTRPGRLRVDLSRGGMVHVCAPDGDFSGYKKCA
jgi:type IV fimbrial biogenesis protein FimT